MKIRLFSLLVPAVLTVGLCSEVRASQMPSEIRAQYAAQTAAGDKRDFRAFASRYAPNFVGVSPAGKLISRAAWLGRIHDSMMHTTKAVVRVTYGDAKNHDGLVDVPFDATLKLTSPAGLTTIHEIAVDSWRKIGGIWLIVKAVDKVVDVTPPKPVK